MASDVDDFKAINDRFGHDAGEGRDAAAIGERLLASVLNAAAASGVTPSIGIAGPGPAAAVTMLLRAADEATYEAKRCGKNRFVVNPNPEGSR